MTKTGIIALLMVIATIFTIGVVGFIFVDVASPEEATPSAQRVEVKISNLSFQPASITVGRGSIIVWRNQDTVAHTVTAEDGSFNSGTIVEGDTFEQRFDKVKIYTYSCSIHPEMKGTIIVE